MTHSAAVAVVPFNANPPFDLSEMALDTLEWPLGRPPRLTRGTVADMAPEDHLILFPNRGFWFKRRGRIRAGLSFAIVEPRAYHGRQMALAARLHRRFRHVLTADAALVANVPNALFVPFGTTWVPDWRDLDLTKTHDLSLIASKKRSLPGHKLRHQCVKWLRTEGIEASILGRGYQPFRDKSEGLAPYRFSVVIENVRETDYFTEKLLDAVLCRTVPIYWGCPNIGDFIDTRGIIQCDSFGDLKHAIRGIRAGLYEEKLAGLQAAIPAADHYGDYYSRAARTVLEADTDRR